MFNVILMWNEICSNICSIHGLFQLVLCIKSLRSCWIKYHSTSSSELVMQTVLPQKRVFFCLQNQLWVILTWSPDQTPKTVLLSSLTKRDWETITFRRWKFCDKFQIGRRCLLSIYFSCPCYRFSSWWSNHSEFEINKWFKLYQFNKTP